MPVLYHEWKFDYSVDGPFHIWLQRKDSAGWELVTVHRDLSNLEDQHVLYCIFRKQAP